MSRYSLRIAGIIICCLLLCGFVLYFVYYRNIHALSQQAQQAVKEGRKIVERTDGNGIKQRSVDINGTVTSWDSSKGILTLQVSNSKIQYEITPPKTILIVPNAPQSKIGFMIKSKEDANWQTAFCQGDTVTVSELVGKARTVAVAYSLGPRTCIK